MSSRKHVVIIGAGVVGLQTAISLLTAGCSVTIVAKHYPGDESIEYTSPWGGAQWRTHATPDTPEQCQWDIESYNHWLDMIGEEEKDDPQDAVRKSGLGRFQSVFLWTSTSPEIARKGPGSLWWAPHVRNFCTLHDCKAPPYFPQHSICSGVSYTSISINVSQHLKYLLNRAISLGAQIIRCSLPTDTGLSGAIVAAEALVAEQTPKSVPISAFVNATGISALKLVPDENIFPIRGQTVLVKGLVPQMRAFEDANPAPPNKPSITYIIPRPGTNTTILGGTKVAGDWRAEPDQDITSDILKRCKGMAPELLTGNMSKDEGFEVLAVNVGLRPGKKGGPRVEIEEVKTKKGVRVVCHEYGHAGAGYQNSIGSAKKVLRLLGEYLNGRRENAESPKL